MHVDGRRWHSGVFVGVDRRTGQYVIYSDDQRLARTVVRVPEADKWCKESLSAVRCTPWDLHVPREKEIIFKEKIDKGEGNFEEKVIIARQPYIRAADLEQFGMTRGYPKCDHYIKYQTWGSRPHSSACRTIFTTELSKIVLGQMPIAAASDRLDKTVEELGRQHRTDVPQGEKLEVAQHQPTEQV